MFVLYYLRLGIEFSRLMAHYKCILLLLLLLLLCCLINLYWQKYKQTQQIYQASKKDCTQKPRSCTMVISKGDHDTVQG